MSTADMGNFQYQDLVDPTLFTYQDDPAMEGSSFDDIFLSEIPEADPAHAPQTDATFNFHDYDFDQPGIQSVDTGFDLPTIPQSSLEDQRYVSFQSQSKSPPSSVWRPLEQHAQQLHYPDPEFFSLSPSAPTPYYPLQPLSSVSTMKQNSFRAITPPGKQCSSIDRQLFLHGNMGPPPAPAGSYSYEPIQTYQDNGAFTPEDLALSDIPEDLFATAIGEGWALAGNNMPQQGSHPNDFSVPYTRNYYSDAELSDADFDPDYKPSYSSKAKKARRSRPSRPSKIQPNGEVKKGRPCAKPQTEERKRVNQRRMEGYYRRKHDQGNLEKARQQSKESYWRRKQRRIEAGEKVRSYNTLKRGRVEKKM